MKAAVFHEPGGPEKIQLAEVPRPQAGPEQVLVQVKASALNHMDLLVLREADPHSWTFPFWGGADIAGVVAEVGQAVDQFNPGDRIVVNPSLYCGHCEHCIAGEESQCNSYGIIGDTIPGGFAEFIAVDAKNVLKLPDELSFTTAAAASLVYQTAWRALISRAKIRPGEDVLILGASGGVGSVSIQIAKLAGAHVLPSPAAPKKQQMPERWGPTLYSTDRRATTGPSWRN